jgi:hypothetical protein
VQVWPGGLEAESLPGPVHQEQQRDVLDPPLHGHQADQVAVECAEHFVDAGGLALLGEHDQGVRGKHAAPPVGLAVPGCRRTPPGERPGGRLRCRTPDGGI